jgi:conjugative relaxase-like TrwC/TraI family protein
VLTIRAMSDGKGYAARYLAQSDYYAEGERVVGHWKGRGGELLGLSGPVQTEDFEAVRQGLAPRTGEFLRQRHSADRVADGTTLVQARHLYDFTVSAPKSVSIMAILGADERLMAAHEKAVAEAVEELETHAASRVRRAGANEDRTTGNLILAIYHHDSSRELDPQIHTHAVAANLTYDGSEGRWKALQASGIYERRAYLTEVYRNCLAREVRALGYEIENRREAKGRDGGFEIQGVSAALLRKYSQRSRQRDAAIEAFIEKNGRQPTDREIAVLVRETRAEKLVEISTQEVRSRQRARLSTEEAAELAWVRNGCRVRPESSAPAEPSLRYAEAHIFERVSVAREHEVLTEALRHGRGRVNRTELEGLLVLQESSGAILRDGGEIATAESLQREREMVSWVNQGIGKCEPLGGKQQFVASDRLRPEQKRAVTFILGSRDQVVNMRGAAGTGKTATLKELRRGLAETGREVLALAPTMSAVEELQKIGFAEAITAERLLQDQRTQAALLGKVLIVDEAGMVSGRQMWELLRLAAQQSARLVFCGDTKQIQSVEAGDALQMLEQESRLKSVALTQVRRQTKKDYRESIQELRRNPERGFAMLDAIGAVREVDWLDRAEAVARAFEDAPGRSRLVVCATHDEITRVTEAIRATRKKQGELGKCVPLTRQVSLNWTIAQKSNLKSFRAGQILGFHRAVKGIMKNEALEVVRVEGERIVVHRASGGERTITSKHAKSFDVLEARDIEIAPGDRLLLTANRRERGFRATNGEIVTVAQVNAAGLIRLEDGRALPPNYRQFAHGYAVTAHRSQGKSVDSVIISGDGMQKELFYVAASRGRESVIVVTSDKERLRETVACSTARKSASELARRAGPGLLPGNQRGLATARALVRRAAQFVTSLPKRVWKEPRMERKHEHGISR